MEDKKIEKVKIQSYKHNGELYRNWDDTVIIEENDLGIVCYNNKIRVTEIDGRKWNTKEPAIIFYYKNNWFNIICQFKQLGIYYYCNIATPYIIEDKTIKYIDYDLDLRIFPDGSYKVLDEGEYAYHKKLFEYSEEINTIVRRELNELITMYKDQKGPFNKAFLMEYYEKYNKNAKK